MYGDQLGEFVCGYWGLIKGLSLTMRSHFILVSDHDTLISYWTISIGLYLTKKAISRARERASEQRSCDPRTRVSFRMQLSRDVSRLPQERRDL